MGKKSSHKNLRKLAAELPEITVYRKVGSIIKREEAVERGLKLPDKLPSNSDVLRMVESVPGPVNHYRNMKRILEKDGSEGVLGYVSAVNRFHAQRLQQEVINSVNLGQPVNLVSTESPDSKVLAEGEYVVSLSAPTFDEGEE